MKQTERYDRNNPWLWIRNAGADFEALPVRHTTSLLKQNVGHNRLISNSGFNWVWMWVPKKESRVIVGFLIYVILYNSGNCLESCDSFCVIHKKLWQLSLTSLIATSLKSSRIRESSGEKKHQNGMMRLLKWIAIFTLKGAGGSPFRNVYKVMIFYVLYTWEGNLGADREKYHVVDNKHMEFFTLGCKNKNNFENI